MSSSRVFYGTSHVRQRDIITTQSMNPAYTLRLSPDGQFLAIGNDIGQLEVYTLEETSWRRVSVYESGTSIRALVWHPVQRATILCGSANGCLHMITIVLYAANIIRTATVPGYIHLLQMSADGSRLAIGHGQSLSIVNNPFISSDKLGTLEGLKIPIQSNVQSLSEYQLARGVFFPSSRLILVAFLGRKGITAFSLIDFSPLWSIRLRESTFLGSAAISPSGERLAVMNLTDGIDFYSTTHRRLLCTTQYKLSTRNPPRNLMVDITFIDEDTVAFGHSDGYVAFATFGVSQLSGTFNIDEDGYRAPIQTIAFGFIKHQPFIFAAVPPFDPWTSSHDASTIKVHVGQIEIGEELGFGASVRPLVGFVSPPDSHLDTISKANVLHFTPIQIATLLFITVGTTLYAQSQLMWTSRTDFNGGMATTSIFTTTMDPVKPTSSLLSQLSPTSPAHAHPFYEFILTGTVTGSAAMNLPAETSNV